MTIHHLLGFCIEGKLENKRVVDIHKYEYVFIHEFFTIPVKLMSSLIDLLRKYNGVIVFSGDVYQNGYINTG